MMKYALPSIVIGLTLLAFMPVLNAGIVVVISGTSATSSPTASPTATQTANAYCHQYTSAVDGSTFWAGVCDGTPTPIPLSSPIIFQSGVVTHCPNGSAVGTTGGASCYAGSTSCTPVGDGHAGASTGTDTATDDTACLNTTMNEGDMEIFPATGCSGHTGCYYRVFSSAQGSSFIFLPTGRNIRGCSDPSNNCSSNIANYNPKSNLVAFGNEGDCSYGYFGFETQAGHYGGSFYGLQWRGINYNAMNTCTVDSSFTQSWISIGGQGTGGIIVAVNDFNGIAGNSGEVNFTDSGHTNSPEETSSIVEWDWFTNSLVNSLELTQGTNNLAQWDYVAGVYSSHNGTPYGSDMFNNEPLNNRGNGTISCTGLLSGISGTMNTSDNCNLFRNIDYLGNAGGTTISNQIYGISVAESTQLPGFNYSGNVQMNTHQSGTNGMGTVTLSQGFTSGGAGGVFWNNVYPAITATPSYHLSSPPTSCTNPITGYCSNQ